MDFIKNNKMYIGVIILVVAAFWVYITYFSSTSSATVSTDTTSPLSQDVLATLSSLNVIKLDASIFTDPLFTSLSDYRVVIPTQDAGRRNPFAPLTSLAPLPKTSQ